MCFWFLEIFCVNICLYFWLLGHFPDNYLWNTWTVPPLGSIFTTGLKTCSMNWKTSETLGTGVYSGSMNTASMVRNPLAARICPFLGPIPNSSATFQNQSLSLNTSPNTFTGKEVFLISSRCRRPAVSPNTTERLYFRHSIGCQPNRYRTGLTVQDNLHNRQKGVNHIRVNTSLSIH